VQRLIVLDSSAMIGVRFIKSAMNPFTWREPGTTRGGEVLSADQL
jgi:hypothetical protein